MIANATRCQFGIKATFSLHDWPEVQYSSPVLFDFGIQEKLRQNHHPSSTFPPPCPRLDPAIPELISYRDSWLPRLES